MNTEIRDIEPEDYEHLVGLNAEVVQWTSAMSKERLRELVGLAEYRKVVVSNAQVNGFILVMANSSDYHNDNFGWFKARYESFLYIDRIVIDAAQAGLGLGKHLYEHLAVYARQTGVERLVCEYTFKPSNDPSKYFHANLGFSEVGRRALSGSEKVVSLQMKPV